MRKGGLIIMFFDKPFCRSCFKRVVDDTAVDELLLLSSDDMICSCCDTKGPVVSHYFKFGEHRVTDGGKRVLDNAKHVGVNPNYVPWGNVYPYADVTDHE